MASEATQATEVELTVNGRRRRLAPRPGETLLDLLRTHLDLLSPKRGCPPQGQCGACLAIVDGEPRMTCTVAAERAGGLDVLTLEGVPAGERESLARAFTAAGAIQCGFCTPAIVLRAKHLLDRQPSPTRGEIARALAEHLCRCSG
jgi:xanthine dehydrogenase molybdenum-binding subunit